MAGIEKVIFMNMCMVYDKEGNVVALDKVGKNYSGTTFPGGHVELLQASVVVTEFQIDKA